MLGFTLWTRNLFNMQFVLWMSIGDTWNVQNFFIVVYCISGITSSSTYRVGIRISELFVSLTVPSVSTPTYVRLVKLAVEFFCYRFVVSEGGCNFSRLYESFARLRFYKNSVTRSDESLTIKTITLILSPFSRRDRLGVYLAGRVYFSSIRVMFWIIPLTRLCYLFDCT